MGVEGLDFYLLDDELTEEERLARDTVRRFVDAEITPIKTAAETALAEAFARRKTSLPGSRKIAACPSDG